MPAIPAAGCGLFLLLSGLLCWLTNNSLEKIFRPRPPLEFPVSPFHLNTIYPSLCCYGVAISTALAIILAYVTTLTSRAIAATNGVSDVEMNHLPPSPAAVGTEITKVKTRFRVFETSRFRSVRASILLCNRLVSFLHLQPADE
ncbi:hypothetical protein COLO4_26362 [Corchorus olitorius]|uniref:Uncharacterized protein n=1 Tax=Corchorus olitorius TaxID=93759 RepID=A0A1R3HXF6_9ROSI|nr:hypothetical protein COLO4_26362 [Corchorus olitorius]